MTEIGVVAQGSLEQGWLQVGHLAPGRERPAQQGARCRFVFILDRGEERRFVPRRLALRQRKASTGARIIGDVAEDFADRGNPLDIADAGLRGQVQPVRRSGDGVRGAEFQPLGNP